MKIQTTKNINLHQRGVIIILAVLILGILLLLGTYFLSFTLTESKISETQKITTQTYYLAEAGVNEAIWKLKNDPVWKSNFETQPGCQTWSASFSRNGAPFSNGSYNVQITNFGCAKGEITSTATLNLPGGKVSQRAIETKVFKAIGGLTEDSAILSGGTSENISIMASILNIHDGNFFSNNNAHISLFSTVTANDNPETTEILEGKALANGNINITLSTLNSTATCAKNICDGDCVKEGCPASSISMPMVDFDSDDSNSYKSQAETAEAAEECAVLCNSIQCGTKCVYTASEFDDLLWDIGKGGTLTLDSEITYVTGTIKLKGDRHLAVNGVLVADGTIDIGEKNCWKSDCGNSHITVADPGGIGTPSGILTKSKMNFGLYSSFQDIDIIGIIYANDEMRLVSIPNSFNITGGILARKVSLTGIWSALNIYLDNAIISEGIWGGPEPPEGGTPPYSPVVTIEHWEESY